MSVFNEHPKDNRHIIKEFTMREANLPHWQQPGAFYFITFSTYNDRKLSAKSKKIIMDAFKVYDGERYELISAIIMSNHCHCVIHPLEREGKEGVFWDLADILKSIKGFTARKINILENKTKEPLWLKESYDRIIRDDKEMERFLEYIDNNAIKAGLSDRPGAYEWYYYTEKYVL